MKRTLLFFGVNLLVIAALSIIINILGIGNYLTASGINYQALLVICVVWGMGGAFISLLISKWMAKRFMGVKIITPGGPHDKLVRTVHHLAAKAGLEKMPEVGIYNSQDVNAFATGPSKNNSLVAVSSGMLAKMNQQEIEGVLGHEVAHIANGDMVTMTLVQGVINAFVMFLSRIVAFAISQALGEDEEGGGLGYFAHFMIVMILQTIFGLMALPLVTWFSRHREYKADAGSAALAGKNKMIASLRALQRTYPLTAQVKEEPAMASLQISSKSSFAELISTHPPLEKRIAALERS
jgi:heat shock protein HtpX